MPAAPRARTDPPATRAAATPTHRRAGRERRAQERVHVRGLGQLQADARDRRRRTAARRGGNRQRGAARVARRAQHTSVDSSRADSRSPSGPTLRSRPPTTMATRSQVISTSGRMCVEKKTVLPSLRSSRIRSRTSLRPSGSSPVIGSSSITSSGSPISACAIPIRCSIPFENLRSGRPRAWSSPTRAIKRLARARRSADGSVAERADEVEELLGRQVVVEVGPLGQVAEPALRGQRRGPAGPAPRRARRWEDEPHQHLQRRGLAGAVRPQEPEDLAAVDLESSRPCTASTRRRKKPEAKGLRAGRRRAAPPRGRTSAVMATAIIPGYGRGV